MNILHISNGVTQSTLYKNLFFALNSDGVTQSIVAPTKEDVNCDFAPIPCKYIYQKKNWISRLFFRRKINRITKITEREFDVSTFDIIHAHTWFSDGMVAYKLHKKYGIPYMIAIRNTDINIHYKYLLHLRKLAFKVLNHASKIIFISPSYKVQFFNRIIPQNLTAKLKEKAVFIPNGIDRAWLENRSTKKKQKEGFFNIIFTGGLVKAKNSISAIKAIHMLKEKLNFPIQFTLVGKGYYDNKNYAKQLDALEKNFDFIKILPQLTKEELMELYKSQHLFVMPSHTETFGLVYIEALSQGLPIVYSKGQGVDGIFPEKTVGIAVDSFDVESIEKGILYCINHYNIMAQNVCSLDLKPFSWSKIAEDYQQMYKNIIK